MNVETAVVLLRYLTLEERVDANDYYINCDEWLHNYLEHILCISSYDTKVSTGQWNLWMKRSSAVTTVPYIESN